MLLTLLFLSQAALAAAPSATLRVALAQDIVTLDWTRSISEVDIPILNNIQEGLVRLNFEGKPIPNLAESWTTSADGKTYRLRLRGDVQWSDGTRFTAHHAYDGLIRLLSPYSSSSFASLAFDIAGAEDFTNSKNTDIEKIGIKVVDPRILEIRLNRPRPGWLVTLAHPSTFPVREDMIRQHGSAWTRPGNLVVLGPFNLASHQLGTSLSLVKNGLYRKASSIQLDRIEFKILTADETLTGFEAGSLDLIFDPSESLRTKYRGQPVLKYFSTLRVKRLSFNLQQFPVSDLRIRSALTRSIDRPALTKSMGPSYRTGGSLVAPGLPGFSAEAGPVYNPVSARRILRESRLSPAIKFTFLVPAFDENTQENLKTAQWLKESLEKSLTISIQTEAISDSARWALMTRSGGFSMILHDWRPGLPDPFRYYEAYSPESRTAMRWNNPEYSGLLEKARASALSSQAAAYRRADDFLVRTHAVMVPLYYAPDALIVSRKIRGLVLDPYNHKRLDGVSFVP